LQNLIDIELFPILIGAIPNFLGDKQIYDLTKYAKNIPMSKHEALIGDATSSHTAVSNDLENIIKEVDSCKDLIDKLQEAVDVYTFRYGFYRTKISNSWINIQKKNSILDYHMHPGSVISGALYVKTDDDSSVLNFLNPNPFMKFTAKDNQKLTKYMFERAYVKPQDGQLVLFPSWLSHGSDIKPNMSEERIIISFNTIYVRGYE